MDLFPGPGGVGELENFARSMVSYGACVAAFLHNEEDAEETPRIF